MLNLLTRSRNSIYVPKETVGTVVQDTRRTAARFASLAGALLFALFVGQASAETPQTDHIKFVNVADSTQGLSDFSQFPAINSRGAVAFVAAQDGSVQEVLKWEHRYLRTIASTTASNFTFFSDDVVINNAGVVGFGASLNTGGRAAGIFTSDGFTTKTIVNSTAQGLSGPFLGSPSINASGTVAFQAARTDRKSTVIFTGDGGALTPVLDTLNSDFTTFGGVAINASGQIVVRGFPKDRSEGIFVITPNLDNSAGAPSVIDIVDNNEPGFELFQFGDPVINDAGVVAAFAGGALKLEVLSGNAKGITARTDPTGGQFIDIEHPSINRRGAVAFSVFEANGAQGIFVELTGGASPVAVLQSGDQLFGSTVTAVSVGRFAFNDHFRLAFEYELADGRSGIAIAFLEGDQDGQGDGAEEDEGEK